MSSQEENPSTVWHSLQQQMGSKEENSAADVKPFSIRQYVLASRQRNLLNSWPFPEKYLHLCLNHGLKDVLPPMELLTTLAESLKSSSNLNCPQDDNHRKIQEPDLIEHEQQNVKTEFDLFSRDEKSKATGQKIPISHEDGRHHVCNFSNMISPEEDIFTKPSSGYVHKKSLTMTNSSKTTKHKWRRRKGRHCTKKKSMAEILAAAKYCTVEDLQMINKFCYIESEIEGCHQMGPLEYNSRSEITDEGSNRKAESDEHEVANVDMNWKLSRYKSE
ncbi:hypothetical protein L6164_012048 [Bauhinia variegata]|uniref:Uncharacterized protein n=1 Tax=Bauhinia variegata TaxID=167791 RepID=A0ACB9P954_BAUVA|nr:hypothetical protein L6164_012048 [Bauhinia variegata]